VEQNNPNAIVPAMTDVCQAAKNLIKADEGLVLHAYADPATGGDPWTIGYGHTGPGVREMGIITMDQANALFEADITKFADDVDALLEGDVTENQFGAMVSLAYNIGLGNFEKSSVLRFHNAGDYVTAANRFLLWNMAAGRVMAGLTRRRAEERTLYLTP
jgi:lysozyme